MSNFLDYIEWRGDLSFEKSPFNEIDALILCQITYLNFDGLLENQNFKTEISIEDLMNAIDSSPDYEKHADVGAMINQGSIDVLRAASKSVRYKDIKVTGFVNIVDLEREEQFAAVTYIFDSKKCCIIYRGTDDTIVGFKEDFNLCVLDEVPAQKDAVKYLEQVASVFKGEIYIGGHSKGGNLAVFAAAMCNLSVKKRIESVFNMDGPGFQEKRLQSNEFYEILPKVHSYYPHFSIVGMVFSHAGRYSVVDSSQSGIVQHDPFSWNIKGNQFVLRENFDEASTYFSDTLNKWLMSLSKEQQMQFIETLYKILKSTDAKTNSEIEKNMLKNSFVIWKAWIETEPEMRKNVEETVRQLFKIAHKQLPSLAEIASKKEKKSTRGK